MAPTDAKAYRATMRARYNNQERRGQFPSVYIPRPSADGNDEPPPPPPPKPKDDNSCSGCSSSRDTPYADGHHTSAILTCGHGYCTKCSMFKMVEAKKCLVPGCGEVLSKHMLKSLKQQLRDWEMNKAVKLCQDEDNPRLPLAGPLSTVKPKYDQAAEFLQGYPSTGNWSHVNVDHVRPHLVGFANLFPASRQIALQDWPSTERWSQIIMAIDNLLKRYQGEHVLTKSLSEYLTINLAKRFHGYGLGGIDVGHLLLFVLHLCAEPSPWNKAIAAAKKASKDAKTEAVGMWETTKDSSAVKKMKKFVSMAADEWNAWTSSEEESE